MPEHFKKIVLNRDQNAFRSLFQTFAPRVRTMLLRQGADSETAEEIAQETMLAVWCKSHQFIEERSSLSTWIFTIARNLRIDRVRRQVAWQKYGGDFEEFAATDELPDDSVAREQRREYVMRALDGLPAEQFEVVQLAFIEGLSHSEIARRLELPLGTVKSRLRLAYEKLRASFEGLL